MEADGVFQTEIICCAAFEFRCYGHIKNILIFAVQGSTLDVRICRL